MYLAVTAGLCLTLLFAFPSLVALAADAPTNEGITMSPVNKHYDLKAGQQMSDSLLVLNQGKTDYDFILYTRGYDVSSESYKSMTGNLSNPMADIGQWVSFSQTTYHLKAGDNVTVPYEIQVPNKVTPGAHTGIIYAEIQPKNGDGLVIKRSVGLVLYANVGGVYKQEGSVESVTIPFYQPVLPLHVSARFINTGTAYYEATATLTVYDLFGNKMSDQSKDFTVLPDRPRRVDIDQTGLNGIGIYRADVTTKVLGVEKTVSSYVLVLPTWLLIGVPLLLILIVGYSFIRPKKSRVGFRKPAP